MVRTTRSQPQESDLSRPPQMPSNLSANPLGILGPSRGLFAGTGQVTAPSAWVSPQVAAAIPQSQMSVATTSQSQMPLARRQNDMQEMAGFSTLFSTQRIVFYHRYINEDFHLVIDTFDKMTSHAFTTLNNPLKQWLDSAPYF